MAWRPATDFERALLVDARARWPQTLPLARALCLAPRIEPLLLRNARRRFAPHNPAEVESLLWFGPLIAARGSRECVLHLGVARLLAAEVEATGGPDGLAALWDFTRLHTRHWGAPERLERDLRYAALCGDTEALSAGLRSVLTRMAQTDDAGRLRLARLIKRTLPVVAPAAAPGAPPDPDPPPPEAGVLARYAALTLGDGGPWVQPGPPGALPPGLPLPSAGGTTVLGVELRWDPGGLPILHLTEPTLDGPRIDLPGAPPVRLHLAQADRDGAWYSVQRGTRIALEPPAPGQEFSLTLTSLDGRRRLLRYTAPLDTAAGPTVPTLPPLLIIHVEADRAQAEAIARWLSTQGIPAEPLSETAAAPDEPRGPNRALRLWTDQARAFWANRALDEDPALADGLLLRLDDAEPPAPGAGRLLDWRDWERLAESPAAGPLRKAIEGWWREGKAPALAEPAGQRIAGLSTATTTEIGSPRVAEETAELLRRIKDTAPESPEPLKIGDRLAALGDPRPGVGTAEREVAAHPSDPATEAPEPAPKPAVPTETERLIAELADPQVEPPRRLAIGDRLDHLGDPRRGVGLDADGLPDIDWVLIPGGAFIYQDRQRRQLPTFRIARYPVSNRQYQAFVKGGGYQNEDWGIGLWQWKPEEPHWPQGNRPRTNVDWSEAVAFCRWLKSLIRCRPVVLIPVAAAAQRRRAIFSFPRSAWECRAGAPRPDLAPDAERPHLSPASAWEPEGVPLPSHAPRL